MMGDRTALSSALPSLILCDNVWAIFFSHCKSNPHVSQTWECFLEIGVPQNSPTKEYRNKVGKWIFGNQD